MGGRRRDDGCERLEERDKSIVSVLPGQVKSSPSRSRSQRGSRSGSGSGSWGWGRTGCRGRVGWRGGFDVWIAAMLENKCGHFFVSLGSSQEKRSETPVPVFTSTHRPIWIHPHVRKEVGCQLVLTIHNRRTQRSQPQQLSLLCCDTSLSAGRKVRGRDPRRSRHEINCIFSRLLFLQRPCRKCGEKVVLAPVADRLQQRKVFLAHVFPVDVVHWPS